VLVLVVLVLVLALVVLLLHLLPVIIILAVQKLAGSASEPDTPKSFLLQYRPAYLISKII